MQRRVSLRRQLDLPRLGLQSSGTPPSVRPPLGKAPTPPSVAPAQPHELVADAAAGMHPSFEVEDEDIKGEAVEISSDSDSPEIVDIMCTCSACMPVGSHGGAARPLLQEPGGRLAAELRANSACTWLLQRSSQARRARPWPAGSLRTRPRSWCPLPM